MASAQRLDLALRDHAAKVARDLKDGRALFVRSGHSVEDKDCNPKENPPPDVMPISVDLYPLPGMAKVEVDGARMTLVTLPHVFQAATIVEAGDASIGKAAAEPRQTELALVYLEDPPVGSADPPEWKVYASGMLSRTDLARLKTAVGKLTIETVEVDISVTLRDPPTPRPPRLYGEGRCIARPFDGGKMRCSACLVPSN